MITKIFFAILGLVFLTSCHLLHRNKELGGDRDEHGCIASAGQTWSELNQDCLQLFDVGQCFRPIEIDTINPKAIICAYVIFNDDESKLEFFLPYGKGQNIILIKSKDGKYRSDIYLFDPMNDVLFIKGKAEYKIYNK